ncbi:hypothetical protein [Tropicimonas sp. S265A]|uniref:hypothetical protein n=1 Tax=Tropicimonas sp. S265A TaxID=3415134 RepID=UPI003C7AF9FF
MGWFRELLKEKPPYHEEFANNLYEALVVSGGPAEGSENYLDAEALGVPLTKLDGFSAKRLITLEAFLFAAVGMETVSKAEAEGQGDQAEAHKLHRAMGRVIWQKWTERGIVFDNQYSTGDKCYEEVEQVTESPVQWSKDWLRDFFDDPMKVEENCVRWADQCLKELHTMRLVVRQNL